MTCFGSLNFHSYILPLVTFKVIHPSYTTRMIQGKLGTWMHWSIRTLDTNAMHWSIIAIKGQELWRAFSQKKKRNQPDYICLCDLLTRRSQQVEALDQEWGSTEPRYSGGRKSNLELWPGQNFINLVYANFLAVLCNHLASTIVFISGKEFIIVGQKVCYQIRIVNKILRRQ